MLESPKARLIAGVRSVLVVIVIVVVIQIVEIEQWSRSLFR